MDELSKTQEPEVDQEERPGSELNETAEQNGVEEAPPVSGSIHISEDVIMELAKKTLMSIAGVQPASPGIASKLGIGRKASDGIRVSVEDRTPPVVTVDVYIVVKYGLRIPDVAWDVQESIKNNLEEYTGYDVKAVNINVQGIYFQDKPVSPSLGAQPEEEKTAEPEATSADTTESEKTIPPEIEQL